MCRPGGPRRCRRVERVVRPRGLVSGGSPSCWAVTAWTSARGCPVAVGDAGAQRHAGTHDGQQVAANLGGVGCQVKFIAGAELGAPPGSGRPLYPVRVRVGVDPPVGGERVGSEGGVGGLDVGPIRAIQASSPSTARPGGRRPRRGPAVNIACMSTTSKGCRNSAGGAVGR